MSYQFHNNKYYLVKASEFDNRRARPPPTSYGEQRRHDIEHSYKDLLRELTDPSARVFDAAADLRIKAQSAITEGVQEERRCVLPRLPDKPPHHHDRLVRRRVKGRLQGAGFPGQTLG